MYVFIVPDDRYNLQDPNLDIHIVTGALKMFFRELLEPLIPFRFFQKFIDAYSKKYNNIIQRNSVVLFNAVQMTKLIDN